MALVREHSSVPICLDTEGAQVRCGEMAPDVILAEGARVDLVAHEVTGDAATVTLWPRAVFDVLTVGSVVAIDFDGALLEIERVNEGCATAVVVKGGRVRSNKGATVEPAVALPAMSEKDEAAVAIGAELGLAHYALSFASCADDVARLRELVPAGAQVIAKIESRTGIANMDGIVPAADAVLIDRGDLSREVPIEQIPYYQKAIVRRANRWHRPLPTWPRTCSSRWSRTSFPPSPRPTTSRTRRSTGSTWLVSSRRRRSGSTRWAPWTSCCARCAPSRAPTAATCSPTGPAPGRRRLGRGAATGASWSRPGTGPERAPGGPFAGVGTAGRRTSASFRARPPLLAEKSGPSTPSCTIHVTYQR